MISIPPVAIGAISAAVIAALVSLLGLIISKEQKTSEFRQAWIDALRSDLTSYLTQINAALDGINVGYANQAEKVKTLSPIYAELNKANFNIQLRTNPNEGHVKDIRACMRKFESLTSDESRMTAANVRPIEQEFMKASQDLLKSEWRRVKGGEPTFVLAKIAALFVVVGATVGGGAYALDARSKAHAPVAVTNAGSTASTSRTAKGEAKAIPSPIRP